MHTVDFSNVSNDELYSLLHQFSNIDSNFIFRNSSINRSLYSSANYRYIYTLNGIHLIFAQVCHISFFKIFHLLLFRGGLTLMTESSRNTPSNVRKFLDDIRNIHVKRGFFVSNLVSYNYYDPDISLGLCEAGYVRPSFQRDPYITFILDLTLPEKDLFNDLSSKWRNQYRKALSHGLSITFGNSPDFFHSYLNLHEQMCTYKNLTNYSLSFDDIQQLEVPGREILVALVYQYDIPVSGCILTIDHTHAHYHLASSTLNGRNFYSANFMLWKVMVRLKESGVSTLDLSSVNPIANWGGYHFKKNTGAQLVSYQGEWTSSNCSVFHHLLSLFFKFRTATRYF